MLRRKGLVFDLFIFGIALLFCWGLSLGAMRYIMYYYYLKYFI